MSYSSLDPAFLTLFVHVLSLSCPYIYYVFQDFYVGEGGHDRTVMVKRAVAKELCTSGL